MAEDPYIAPPDPQAGLELPLVEPTRTWNSPGVPNVGRPPIPGRTGELRTDLTRQYVSSLPNQWYLNLTRVLSFAVDDITEEFGWDLYNRFLFDPTVNNCVVTVKADVIEDGLSIQPAIAQKDQPGYEQSAQLVTEAYDMIARYPGGSLDDWLWSMTDAIWRGHTATEITFRPERIGGKMRYTLDRLAVKPPQAFGFAVDNYKKVIGIMGLVPGIGMPVYTGNIVVDPQRQPNMLPREKFCVYTHRPRDEDPRGQSILRPVYTPWTLKMQTLPEYAKWLKQFGSPTLLGFTPQEAQLLALTDAQGNPLQGAGGAPITVANTPEQNMLGVLANVMGGSAGVFPAGSDVKWIEMHGMGNPFLFAMRFFDEQITTGVLGQSLTTMSQRYGTHALGRVQQDTQDTIVRQTKAGICRAFVRDVLRLWVFVNHGESWLPFTPKASLGQIEEPNLLEDLGAYAQAGWQLDLSQFPEVDRRLGLPPRDPDWEENFQLPAKPPNSQNPAAETNRHTLEAPRANIEHAARRRDELAQMADEWRSERWREAVQLAHSLYEQTGIALDPNKPPPTEEELLAMERELLAAAAGSAA